MGMRYKTARALAIITVLPVLGVLGVCTKHVLDSPSAPAPLVASEPMTEAPQPTSPAPQPPTLIPSVQTPPPAPAPAAITTAQIRADLEAWLTNNGDRQGRMSLNNVLPNAPYCANVLRFADEAAAARWSNNPSQWSMFRIDRDRDGHVDEKWLLQNGHTFRREVFGPDGHSVVQTENL